MGRYLYVLSRKPTAQGYYYIAVTRRTRGYIDAAALIIPAERQSARRLMRLIEAAEGIDKLTLCRLFLKNFPASELCADVLLREGEAAERAAQDLTARAASRLKPLQDAELPTARYMINHAGLDRYSRLGIYFRVTEDGRFVYDGAAYRKILARYGKTAAAEVARARLAFNNADGAQARDLF